MSIVRSLLIKVGFQTDKSSVNQANKTVDRFKARFALIASTATYVASKVIGFFNSVSNSLLETNDLSRTLGVSLKEILAIQKAASNFRLNESQFTGALDRLNTLLIGFRTKTNLELAEIARGLKFDIGEDETIFTLFNKISKGLSTIKSSQEQIRVAGNIYSKEIAPGIADIANNLEKFNEANQNFLNDTQDLTKAIDDLKEYQRAVNGLTQAWTDFSIEITKAVVPSLTILLNKFREDFLPIFKTNNKALYDLFFNFDTTGVKDVASKNGELLNQDFDKISNSFLDFIDKLKSNLQPIANYIENSPYNEFEDYGNDSWDSIGAPIITVNNEINVPPGTSEQQTQMMTEAIESTIRAGIDSSWREIQYNNPQVE